MNRKGESSDWSKMTLDSIATTSPGSIPAPPHSPVCGNSAPLCGSSGLPSVSVSPSHICAFPRTLYVEGGSCSRPEEGNNNGLPTRVPQSPSAGIKNCSEDQNGFSSRCRPFGSQMSPICITTSETGRRINHVQDDKRTSSDGFGQQCGSPKVIPQSLVTEEKLPESIPESANCSARASAPGDSLPAPPAIGGMSPSLRDNKHRKMISSRVKRSNGHVRVGNQSESPCTPSPSRESRKNPRQKRKSGCKPLSISIGKPDTPVCTPSRGQSGTVEQPSPISSPPSSLSTVYVCTNNTRNGGLSLPYMLTSAPSSPLENLKQNSFGNCSFSTENPIGSPYKTGNFSNAHVIRCSSIEHKTPSRDSSSLFRKLASASQELKDEMDQGGEELAATSSSSSPSCMRSRTKNRRVSSATRSSSIGLYSRDAIDTPEDPNMSMFHIVERKGKELRPSTAYTAVFLLPSTGKRNGGTSTTPSSALMPPSKPSAFTWRMGNSVEEHLKSGFDDSPLPSCVPSVPPFLNDGPSENPSPFGSPLAPPSPLELPPSSGMAGNSAPNHRMFMFPTVVSPSSETSERGILDKVGTVENDLSALGIRIADNENTEGEPPTSTVQLSSPRSGTLISSPPKLKLKTNYLIPSVHPSFSPVMQQCQSFSSITSQEQKETGNQLMLKEEVLDGLAEAKIKSSESAPRTTGSALSRVECQNFNYVGMMSNAVVVPNVSSSSKKRNSAKEEMNGLAVEVSCIQPISRTRRPHPDAKENRKKSEEETENNADAGELTSENKHHFTRRSSSKHLFSHQHPHGHSHHRNHHHRGFNNDSTTGRHSVSPLTLKIGETSEEYATTSHQHTMTTTSTSTNTTPTTTPVITPQGPKRLSSNVSSPLDGVGAGRRYSLGSLKDVLTSSPESSPLMALTPVQMVGVERLSAFVKRLPESPSVKSRQYYHRSYQELEGEYLSEEDEKQEEEKQEGANMDFNEITAEPSNSTTREWQPKICTVKNHYPHQQDIKKNVRVNSPRQGLNYSSLSDIPGALTHHAHTESENEELTRKNLGGFSSNCKSDEKREEKIISDSNLQQDFSAIPEELNETNSMVYVTAMKVSLGYSCNSPTCLSVPPVETEITVGNCNPPLATNNAVDLKPITPKPETIPSTEENGNDPLSVMKSNKQPLSEAAEQEAITKNSSTATHHSGGKMVYQNSYPQHSSPVSRTSFGANRGDVSQLLLPNPEERRIHCGHRPNQQPVFNDGLPSSALFGAAINGVQQPNHNEVDMRQEEVDLSPLSLDPLANATAAQEAQKAQWSEGVLDHSQESPVHGGGNDNILDRSAVAQTEPFQEEKQEESPGVLSFSSDELVPSTITANGKQSGLPSLLPPHESYQAEPEPFYRYHPRRNTPTAFPTCSGDESMLHPFSGSDTEASAFIASFADMMGGDNSEHDDGRESGVDLMERRLKPLGGQRFSYTPPLTVPQSLQCSLSRDPLHISQHHPLCPASQLCYNSSLSCKTFSAGGGKRKGDESSVYGLESEVNDSMVDNAEEVSCPVLPTFSACDGVEWAMGDLPIGNNPSFQQHAQLLTNGHTAHRPHMIFYNQLVPQQRNHETTAMPPLHHAAVDTLSVNQSASPYSVTENNGDGMVPVSDVHEVSDDFRPIYGDSFFS